MTVRLNQLQALVAVANHGSIRSAARQINLTQAALTKALRALEDDNGVALLVRHSHGVSLTPAGERLHARALMITRQLELVDDELTQERGLVRGQVRFGITPYLALTALHEAFHWFRKRYPQVELVMMEGLVGRVLPSLRNGELDFAFVADTGDVNTHEFQHTDITQVDQVLVVRAGHPVLKRPSVEKLCALEWIVPRPPSGELDVGLAAMFKAAKVSPPERITRCDALIALALLRNSDGISVMPSPLLAHSEKDVLQAVQLPALQPPAINLRLLSLLNLPLSQPAAYFARCLVDAVGSGTSVLAANASDN